MMHALLARLNEWSRWDSLRKLGTSPLVRSSLVFAATGYFLLWNDKLQDFLTIKFDTHASLWRVWMVYYGGVCLAVATWLYSSFCPKTIKDHGSAFELARDECQFLITAGFEERYIKDVEELEAGCTPSERALWPSGRPQSVAILRQRGTIGEADRIAALIVYAWRIHNIKRPRIRSLVLLIYGLGFCLLTIPALWTFGQVTLFAVGHLL